MLEKFLNKKVEILIASYARVANKVAVGVKQSVEFGLRKGIVTNVDNNFIELDNDEVVAIKYIVTIKSI